MGVPVLTWLGDRACARVGASLLREVGLDDFIVDSVEHYIEAAVRWVERVDELNEVRFGLRDRLMASPLGDGRKFAEEFFSKLIEAYRVKTS